MPGWHHGQTKTGVPPPWNSKRCDSVLCTTDSRGRTSASWAPCTQVWAALVGQRQNQSLWCTTHNTKYSVDVLDQMARARSVIVSMWRWPVAVFYNNLNLAGINARILFKEHQQQTIQGSEESPAAACRGAEGRIPGEERGCGRRHKVGSSEATTAAAAAAAAATADTNMEAVSVRKSCKWNQTSDTWNATSGNCGERR